MFKRLNSREKKIFKLYFYEEKTLEEIAHIFLVSKERLRQLLSKIYLKLKNMSEKEMEFSNFILDLEYKFPNF